MTETHPTPDNQPAASEPVPNETAAEISAAIMPVPEPAQADPEPSLEPSGELEEPTAEILDAELARLLTTPAGVQAGIEALLFASPEPLSPRKIGRVLGIGDLKLIQTIIAQIHAQYESEGRGVQIIETAGGYQMATREVYADLVLRLRGRKRRPSLSPAALETLAIVAYRQPIIRAEIEAVRGVESSGMLRNLMDMGLVEIVGRKDVLGRPAMYGTSESFLQSFGLKSLAELPPIAELKRRLAEQAEAAPAQEPAAAPDSPAPPDVDSAQPESQVTTETTAMKEDQDPIEDDEPFDDQDDNIDDLEDDEGFDDEDDEDELDDEDDDDLGLDDDEDFEEDELEDDDLDGLDEDLDEDEEDLDEDEDEDEDRPGR